MRYKLIFIYYRILYYILELIPRINIHILYKNVRRHILVAHLDTHI